MNRRYHFASVGFTYGIPVVLACSLFLFGLFLWYVNHSIVEGNFTGSSDAFFLILTFVMWGIGGPWFVWSCFTSFFIYEFDGTNFNLLLFFGKRVKTYQSSEVQKFHFERKQSDKYFIDQLMKGKGHKWADLVVEFKDGRRIRFNYQMEKYTQFINDFEKWLGVPIPGKDEMLKGRGDSSHIPES